MSPAPLLHHPPTPRSALILRSATADQRPPPPKLCTAAPICRLQVQPEQADATTRSTKSSRARATCHHLHLVAGGPPPVNTHVPPSSPSTAVKNPAGFYPSPPPVSTVEIPSTSSLISPPRLGPQLAGAPASRPARAAADLGKKKTPSFAKRSPKNPAIIYPFLVSWQLYRKPPTNFQFLSI